MPDKKTADPRDVVLGGIVHDQRNGGGQGGQQAEDEVIVEQAGAGRGIARRDDVFGVQADDRIAGTRPADTPPSSSSPCSTTV